MKMRCKKKQQKNAKKESAFFNIIHTFIKIDAHIRKKYKKKNAN